MSGLRQATNTMNTVAEWRWHGGQLSTGTNSSQRQTRQLPAVKCRAGTSPAYMATHSPQESCTPSSLLTSGNRISGDSVPLLSHNHWCISQICCSPAHTHRGCLRCYTVQPPQAMTGGKSLGTSLFIKVFTAQRCRHNNNQTSSKNSHLAS